MPAWATASTAPGAAIRDVSTAPPPPFERAVERKPFVVELPQIDGLLRVLFVPDCHVPYEDKKAFELLLRAAAVFKPDLIVILGDFADFYAVSSHSKDPRRVRLLKDEVTAVQERLQQLKAICPRIIYVSGNHEDRLSRYLQERAPELFGHVEIPEVLGLRELGIQYVEYKDTYHLGKLHVTHDTGTAGQNAHRQSMTTFGRASTIIGHTHRMEYSVIGNADGPPALGAMFGWLGDFDAIDYMHKHKIKADWVHGFGVGYMEPNGIVHVRPCPIVNGAVVIDGVLVR